MSRMNSATASAASKACDFPLNTTFAIVTFCCVSFSFCFLLSICVATVSFALIASIASLGGATNHPGNRHFREIVCAHQAQCVVSEKGDEKIIVAKVVEVVRESGGRFLQKANNTQWVDVGDKKAFDKTRKALKKC